MSRYEHIFAKSDGTPLLQHLQDVAKAAEVMAQHWGLSTDMARKGAHLHDIGKASPIFQSRLKAEDNLGGDVFVTKSLLYSSFPYCPMK